MLKRSIDAQVDEYLRGESYKTLFIWGPRRSGKTTLLKRLSKELHVPFFNFDYQHDRELFVPKRDVLRKIVSERRVILIDEVQNSPESTVALKLLYDDFKVKVIATGSSELRQKVKQEFDTMAGRFYEAYCLPLSIQEITDNTPLIAYEKDNFFSDLQNKLQIFGSYPEIYAPKNVSEAEKIDLLEKILNTYVLKDVIDIYELKNEKLARDILTKIALQLGSEVSIREIAMSLNANQITVSNYVEIFIKNYILIPLPSFQTNMRKAVSENRKLFFYDLGIRNVLVKDFRNLEFRPDRGGLFENFIVSEIEKLKRNFNAKFSIYFYREYGGKEIDLIVEDYKKNYTTIEIKTTKGDAKNIFPLYSVSQTINSKNYFEKINAIVSNT